MLFNMIFYKKGFKASCLKINLSCHILWWRNQTIKNCTAFSFYRGQLRLVNNVTDIITSIEDNIRNINMNITKCKV